MLEKDKSQSLELLCKQERYTCRLLVEAVCSMKFIVFSARLSTINNTMADGLSKSRGHLWKSRVGITVFGTISNTKKIFEVFHGTLDEK